MWKTFQGNGIWMFVALTLVATLGGCGGDEGCGSFCELSTPRVVLSQASVTFGEVMDDDRETLQVAFDNRGNAPLILDNWRLDGEGYTFTLVGEATPGLVELAPDTSLQVAITFQPVRAVAAQGQLCVDTNDVKRPSVCVELNAAKRQPLPVATPGQVVFTLVDPGEQARDDVCLINVGSADLVLTEVAITGSSDFVPDPAWGLRDALQHPAGEWPVLPPGGSCDDPATSLHIPVVYAPPRLGPDEGTLRIRYLRSPDSSTDVSALAVALEGNRPTPCLRVTERLDFDGVRVGDSAQLEVTLENCGTADVTLSSLALDSEIFGLDDTLETPLVIRPWRAVTTLVTMTPLAAVDYDATLQAVSDDPWRPVIDVALSGRGIENRCPTVFAQARIAETNQALVSDLVVEPVTMVWLDGLGSTDPDGDDLQYVWSIIEAPRDYRLPLRPVQGVRDGSIMQLEVAQIGDYVVELTAIDAYGAPACNTSRVTIRAISNKALVIELTWDTPGDEDPTDIGHDRGSDLDLHLLAPNGIWNDRVPPATDCFFLARQPDWGLANISADDPHLDRDDIDGEGPEQINIEAPAWTRGANAFYGVPYQIGVYYYNGHKRFGRAYARLTLYLDGEIVRWPSDAPDVGRQLNLSGEGLGAALGEFWLAGEIDWSVDGPSVREVDQISAGFPN